LRLIRWYTEYDCNLADTYVQLGLSISNAVSTILRERGEIRQKSESTNKSEDKLEETKKSLDSSIEDMVSKLSVSAIMEVAHSEVTEERKRDDSFSAESDFTWSHAIYAAGGLATVAAAAYGVMKLIDSDTITFKD